MKTSTRCLPLLLAIVLVASCSDDDGGTVAVSAAPQPIAEIDMTASGGGAVSVDSMDITLSMGVVQPDEAVIFSLRVTDADNGTQFTVNSSNNPDFAAAVAVLTNGTDDWAMLENVFPGGGGGSGVVRESQELKGGYVGNYDPDLAGVEITHMIVHLDEVSVDTPGSDPNGNGLWTDYVFGLRVVIMGRP